MIMLVICFWWLVLRWAHTESWIWAILAGMVGGLAIYVKFVAAFFVIGRPSERHWVHLADG